MNQSIDQSTTTTTTKLTLCSNKNSARLMNFAGPKVVDFAPVVVRQVLRQ